jgi:hypothetical protein
MFKLLLLPFMVFAFTAYANEHTSCPHHAEHQKMVEQKGDEVMGFDHTKTTHHFLLKPDGGVIVADAIDPKDRQSIEQIRTHFVEISKMFSKGDFSKPREIHGEMPPGVPEMIELKDSISYTFQERENGGEILISTKDDHALEAIHSFLRFQIEEHHTGD